MLKTMFKFSVLYFQGYREKCRILESNFWREMGGRKKKIGKHGRLRIKKRGDRVRGECEGKWRARHLG